MSDTFLPLFAKDLGADIGTIGLIIASQGIGAMLCNLPAGFISRRFQEKHLLLIGFAGMAVAALLRSFSRTSLLLLLAGVVMGMFSSVVGIARLTYLRINLPVSLRGRFLANLGGVLRVSRVLSPVIGGLLIQMFGFRLIFLLHFSLILLAASVVLLILPAGNTRQTNDSKIPVKELMDYSRRNSKRISVALFGINGLALIRASRTLLIPLWADYLGISVSLIGIITSSSAAVETLLVLPAGVIMDKKGRKWAAVPCTFLLALSVALIPLSTGFLSLLAVALLAGFGNGLGSGINMTISTDLAPDFAPGEFLGMWSFITNAGMTAGAGLVGSIAEIFSLALAPLVTGFFGVCVAVTILVFMDETRQLAGL